MWNIIKLLHLTLRESVHTCTDLVQNRTVSAGWKGVDLPLAGGGGVGCVRSRGDGGSDGASGGASGGGRGNYGSKYVWASTNYFDSHLVSFTICLHKQWWRLVVAATTTINTNTTPQPSMLAKLLGMSWIKADNFVSHISESKDKMKYYWLYFHSLMHALIQLHSQNFISSTGLVW